MTEYLQLIRAGGGFIEDTATLGFDSVAESSENISYDSGTGIITINRIGVYDIKWSVATQSAGNVPSIVFAVQTQNSGTFQGSSQVKTGETSGSATVVVDDANLPLSLWIENQSGQRVYLADYLPVKASLTIKMVEGIGATGATGITGATGPEGPPGVEAIIPFSSGGAITLTTLVGGLVGAPSFVGFGSNFLGIDVLRTTINLEGDILGTALNFAFMVPRDGVITRLDALFSATLGTVVGLEPYFVHAALYRSPDPANNEFTQIPESDIQLTPGLSVLITLGEVLSGSVDLNVPVSRGDRLLLVFYLQPPTAGLAGTVTGYASAGLLIE